MFKKRFISLLIAVAVLLPLCVSGVSALGEDEITAPAAVLMEPSTKKVMFEKNPHDIRPCASITKVMTLILVFEAIENGKLDYTDLVTASAHAASMGGSDIWLEEGEQMTVDHMIKAVVVASANDAAVALAEAICGTEEEFVNKMNEKAKMLGMNDTTFKNCNGLDEEGHLTSAYDVALMSAELIKPDLIKNYSTAWMDTLRGGESELVNTNKLVRFYKGTTGLKIGTTSKAGYCLSATAERDGLELVAVIMSGETSQDRFNGAKKLLDYGFANYAYNSLEPNLEGNCEISVKNGVKQSVKIEAKDNFCLLLKKSDASGVTQKLNLEKTATAPVKKGSVVGSVDFYSGDTQIGSVNITAAESVDKMTFLTAFLWVLNGLLE